MSDVDITKRSTRGIRVANGEVHIEAVSYPGDGSCRFSVVRISREGIEVKLTVDEAEQLATMLDAFVREERRAAPDGGRR